MHARCPIWICASWILLDTSQCGHCRPHATVWCLHCSAIEWFHCTIGALRAVVVLHKGIFLHEWVHVRRCPLFVQIIENLYRWFLKELCKKNIQMSALFNVCLLVHACSRCLVIITQHWQPHHVEAYPTSTKIQWCSGGLCPVWLMDKGIQKFTVHQPSWLISCTKIQLTMMHSLQLSILYR